MTKSSQLQVRVTAEQKRRIREAAEREGKDISHYVLARVLPDEEVEFQDLVAGVTDERRRSYALAALNDFFEGQRVGSFRRAVGERPFATLEPLWANYVAAMTETAANRKGVLPPAWVRDIQPLRRPWFATDLQSLRLYLLCESPPAFRRRNLFIDATLGDRV